jgi:putative membrane protein
MERFWTGWNCLTRNKEVRRIKQSHFLIILLALFAILLTWSAIGPKDYVLWILEMAPAIVGLGLLLILYRKLPFTSTTYFWCFVAACTMAIGAHYSYSEVPFFDLLKNIFHSDRNNFDKMGHFIQGIVPALITQEVLIRKGIILAPRMINFLSFCVAMTVAAMYELIEWLAILLSPDVSENFLGMQGYIWDAQSDMFFALLGALAVILFSKRLRRAIALK